MFPGGKKASPTKKHWYIYAQEGAAELVESMNNLPLPAAVKLFSKGFYKGTLITPSTSPHLPSMPNIALDFNHFDR